MPRAIWKRSLSFGLVNVPVGLYPATMERDMAQTLIDSCQKNGIQLSITIRTESMCTP
jgi:non-homologous end joining protein Ku